MTRQPQNLHNAEVYITPRGQPGTPAVTLPHGRDGLSARGMAVLWTFREPSLYRHVRRELMGSVPQFT